MLKIVLTRLSLKKIRLQIKIRLPMPSKKPVLLRIASLFWRSCLKRKINDSFDQWMKEAAQGD